MQLVATTQARWHHNDKGTIKMMMKVMIMMTDIRMVTMVKVAIMILYEEENDQAALISSAEMMMMMMVMTATMTMVVTMI